MDDLVTDASTWVCALTGTTTIAADLRTRLVSSRCHAPHVVDAEVGHVLRRRERCGALEPDTALTALRLLRTAVDERYPHAGPIAELAWTQRKNLSYYDALYVALSSALRIPLLTLDARLANAPNLPCEVELLIDN
jgi:predicted nucleic acid-binding protein